MKVTTERLPKSIVALDIEIDPQQVNKGLERAARKLSQQYTIPGFRPGKAPRFIVENYLGRARIMEEASDDLINKAFQEAIKQENLTPVGKANLESVEDEPFRFRVTVPVEPTVELADYRQYRLPYNVEPVTDETVEKLLEAQREQHAVLRELDEPRPAQAGDMVTVTMTSDLDDDDEDDDDENDDDEDDDEDDEVDENAFADLVAMEDDVELDVDEDEDDFDDEDDDEDDEEQETQIALVEGRVRPEIYQALLGAQAGESRTVTIQYGDDEEDEQLRGREVAYQVEVKNVQERLLPEWDELPTLTDFQGDLDAFRANARQRLEHASEERARRDLVEAFFERAVAESTLDIPDALIEERADELFHQQVGQLARYGITEEQFLTMSGKTHDEATAEFNETAEKDVRRSLVVREILRSEGLGLDEGDTDAEIERFLQDYDESRREEMRPLLSSPQMKQMLASAALDRKLRDRLVAIAGDQSGAAAEEVASDQAGTPVEEAASEQADTPAEDVAAVVADDGSNSTEGSGS
ncbi:MAG TPA: trigger factor [Herpetosiphonaceae bacterium]|nr:trigger factor [Herpetosiphonaceae bacterium]